MRSSKFTPLGKHRIYFLAAPRNPASRKRPTATRHPGMPGSVARLDLLYSCQHLVKVLLRWARAPSVLGGRRFLRATD